MRVNRKFAVALFLVVAMVAFVGCGDAPTGIEAPAEQGVTEGSFQYLKANQEMMGLAKGMNLYDVELITQEGGILEVFGGAVEFPENSVEKPTLFFFRLGIEKGNLVFIVTVPGHRGHFELDEPAVLKVDKRFVRGEPDFAENMNTGERYYSISQTADNWECSGIGGFTRYAWGLLD